MNNEFESTPALTNDQVISTLNGLIETCKNGEEGFKNASENIKEDANLQTLFREYSEQRSRFANELISQVTSLGGEPSTDSTIAGALHRGWIDVKAAFTGGDAGAILGECERGEDIAKDGYRDALKQALPTEIADVIRNQYNSILEAHQKIKALRDNAGNQSTSAVAS